MTFRNASDGDTVEFFERTEKRDSFVKLLIQWFLRNSAWFFKKDLNCDGEDHLHDIVCIKKVFSHTRKLLNPIWKTTPQLCFGHGTNEVTFFLRRWGVELPSWQFPSGLPPTGLKPTCFCLNKIWPVECLKLICFDWTRYGLWSSGGAKIESRRGSPPLLPPPTSPSLILLPQICRRGLGGLHGISSDRRGSSPCLSSTQEIVKSLLCPPVKWVHTWFYWWPHMSGWRPSSSNIISVMGTGVTITPD